MKSLESREIPVSLGYSGGSSHYILWIQIIQSTMGWLLFFRHKMGAGALLGNKDDRGALEAECPAQ